MTGKRKRRLAWLKWIAGAGALGTAAAAAGFMLFYNLIEHGPAADLSEADAIVVLTGGPARIPEAVKLLMQGKGKRLLISGVNTATTRSELAALSPGDPELFDCCVDIGHQALNTIGNAEETSSWVRESGFRSIIVVTGNYHMPRSLAEIRRALPETELIPYPVTQDNLHLDRLWSYPGTMKLLASEYVKFIPAFARCVIIQIGHERGIYGGARMCVNAAALPASSMVAVN